MPDTLWPRRSGRSRSRSAGSQIKRDPLGSVGLRSESCASLLSVEAKQAVRALLERLPDDCSLDDILYHLYVVQQVEAGLADAEAGRLIPHEQVQQELERKWLLGAE